jgi:shikimate kinase/3-dehydroquinate synthase
MTHVFLYGPPGTGKSTVGEHLADRLNLPFVDLDVEIARTSGRSISDLMAEGETVFRDLETAALFQAIDRPPSVIALGGGALLRAANRCCAEEHGRVVCLDADHATLLARLSQDETPRPLLQDAPAVQLANLLAARRTHYRSFPTRIRLTGEADQGTPAPAIADEVVRRLECLHVRTPDGGGYDVVLRSGGLAELGGELRMRDLAGPVAVVADDTVAHLYGRQTIESLTRAGYEARLATFPAGERSKTLDTVATLWKVILDAGLGRTSCVVALGGGVTGDLAGFAAATFMRGIDWVGVPTTLLAMVDASVGGKTGIDLPDGKNLAGAFHHPRLVLIDPDVLETLPERDLRAGMAEVVKHGIIGDVELFGIVEGGWDAVQRELVDVIRRALVVKVGIVEADPLERGIRASLNLGHTVGHAVEAASDYTLRHGEAVAIGLVAEALLAETLDVAQPGVAERTLRALRRLGLPVAIPDDISSDAVVTAMIADKKRSSGAVYFTLPVAIGEVRTSFAVRDLRAALTACLAPASADDPPPVPSAAIDVPATDRQSRGEHG